MHINTLAIISLIFIAEANWDSHWYVGACLLQHHLSVFTLHVSVTAFEDLIWDLF